MIYLKNTQSKQETYIPMDGVSDDVRNLRYATEGFVEELIEEVRSEIPSLDGYATEDFVEDAVSKEAERAESTYMKKGELPEDIASKQYVDNAVEDLEKKIPSTEGLASEEWVNEQGFLKEHQDISGKADTTYVDDEIKRVEGLIPSIEGLASETYVTNAVEAEKQRSEDTYMKKGDVPTDVYTKAQTDAKIGDAIDAQNFKTINGQSIKGTGDIKIQGGVDEQKVQEMIDAQNFKTINGESIIGEGNIEIEGGENAYLVYLDDETKIADNIETYNAIKNHIAESVFIYENGNLIPTVAMAQGDEENLSYLLEATFVNFDGVDGDTGELDNTQTQVAVVNLTSDGAATIVGQKTLYYDDLVTKDGLKTINGQSIIGDGNIEIKGGGDYLPLTGGTLTGHLTLGGTGETAFKKVEAIRNTNGQINGAAFYVNSDGTACFFHKSYPNATNDAILKFDSTSLKFAKSGARGTTATEYHDILLDNNVKTINGQSIVGTGNIEIQGGGDSDKIVDGDNYIKADRTFRTAGDPYAGAFKQFRFEAAGFTFTFNESTREWESDSSAISNLKRTASGWSLEGDTASETLITSTITFNGVGVVLTAVTASGRIEGIAETGKLASEAYVNKMAGGEKIIELTQEEYDALEEYAENTTYIITDAPSIDLDEYAKKDTVYTKTEADAVLENKADKVTVTASTTGYKFPTWNNQGLVTGTYNQAYGRDTYMNGKYMYYLFGNTSSALPQMYFPTTAGTKGQPLISNGSGEPVWASYKFEFLSQSAYDALATKDATTIYFIVSED